MGLGGALFEAIEFEDGRILNPRFSRYRVPRFRDTPQIEVILLDRKDLPPAGAGETPIVAIAPAIAQRHLRRHRHSTSLAAARTARRQGVELDSKSARDDRAGKKGP